MKNDHESRYGGFVVQNDEEVRFGLGMETGE